MRRVQIALDEKLVRSVDRIVKDLDTTRSEFTRQALREAIRRHQVSQLEEKHRRGYERFPSNQDEFGDWGKESRPSVLPGWGK